MVKKILIALILLLIPFSVIAYSDKIIPGGETLGIKIESNGIIVIGFYKVNGKYNKGNPELVIGDKITHVNNIPISSSKELTKEIEKFITNNEVKLTILRNKQIKFIILKLIENDNKYKTGLYVKDSITGIGTLSYIDPETLIYGALGHEILESNSNSLVEVKTGNIFKNTITGIQKSNDGTPGAKNAKFYYKNVFGTIEKNTPYGIYGKYNDELPDKNVMDVGFKDDVKIGLATIYTVLKDNDIKEYKIDITAINENSEVKNITFEIIDEELLGITGGIVQGMSGSPIIQNNKIIGAVTHVIVDDVRKGYGIFITTMLEEGEK